MKRSPFPLQWPDGWPRARYRDSSAFDKGRGFIAARDGAIHQLELFKCSHIIITSNLPTQASGKPYTASSGVIPDPGIAVWWVRGGREHVLACDRWRSALENMRAIEKTLEAIRGIDRWGSTKMVEQAFAGFAALPPGVPLRPAARPWREVLGIEDTTLAGRQLLTVVRYAYRDLIKKNHPDVGGSHELAAEINAALAEAERELGGAA